MRYPHLTHPPLVAIAHGSRDPRAGATISELLNVARERAAGRGLAGLDIKAAFLDHAPPRPMQVLNALAGELDRGSSPGRRGAPQARARRVGVRRAAAIGGSGGSPPRLDTVVLPLLLTAAYHSGTDIPGLLDEAQAALPGLRIRYGAPLGPHPGLLVALDRRLAEAGQDPGRAGQTAVVLAAAGSSHPAANAVITRLAADWQAAGGWQAVRPAFASAASPTPEQAVARLIRGGARRVVVASYLLAPGRFADRVRDRSLAAGAAAVSAPLGAAPEVADVLLDRYVLATRGAPEAGPAEPAAAGAGGCPPGKQSGGSSPRDGTAPGLLRELPERQVSAR
jgi:sirohydrochlorin ferrochelatase